MDFRFLSIGALAFVVFAASVPTNFVSAAEVVWRQSTEQPADSLEGRGHQKFAELVKKYSNGRMEVKIFPSEQLGKKAAVVDQLQAGTIHIYNSTAAYLSKWEPAMKFISAPFVFADRAHWLRFMKTDLVKGWVKTVEKKGGITLIGDYVDFPRGSWRVIVSKKPVKSIKDIQGLKLRMHPDKLAGAAWTHLGAEVRVLGWTSVYESLGKGIVEAVNSPAALVESMRFYEKAPHITAHREYEQSVGYMVNAKAYNSLPADLRDAVDRAHAGASQYEQGLLDADTMASINRLKAKGVTYNDGMDTGPFRQRMKEFYDAQAKAGKLPKGFLEAVEATR
ncbi:MAG: C4-dicarboxylate ABC transporter substrate-binding protein [Magnetovibrio sp.]|nr:C4-dicarboxylate ABC transporter substrate-binding protein [Magnetovibrio sp.]